MTTHDDKVRELPPLPEPDTHCFDEDNNKDVWSHSAEQMNEFALRALSTVSDKEDQLSSKGSLDNGLSSEAAQPVARDDVRDAERSDLIAAIAGLLKFCEDHFDDSELGHPAICGAENIVFRAKRAAIQSTKKEEGK